MAARATARATRRLLQFLGSFDQSSLRHDAGSSINCCEGQPPTISATCPAGSQALLLYLCFQGAEYGVSYRDAEGDWQAGEAAQSHASRPRFLEQTCDAYQVLLTALQCQLSRPQAVKLATAATILKWPTVYSLVFKFTLSLHRTYMLAFPDASDVSRYKLPADAVRPGLAKKTRSALIGAVLCCIVSVIDR